MILGNKISNNDQFRLLFPGNKVQAHAGVTIAGLLC